MRKRFLMTMVLFILVSLPIHAFAGVGASPFRFASSDGFDNPVLWVLFAPQPEPPKVLTGVDATDPDEVVFTTPNESGGVFQVSFEIQHATYPLRSVSSLTEDGIEFSIYKVPVGAVPQLAYVMHLSFSSKGITIPGLDVMFAPQPEPPRLLFGESFSLLSDFLQPGDIVAMSLQFTDAQGSPVSLTAMPLCECDLSADGQCDMRDWLQFGARWGATDCSSVPCDCDLNLDGRCDMRDWLIFGEDWGRTDCPTR
jgi:hypothetical protein